MAEKIGISIRHLSDIERADSFPSPEVIELIASELDVPSYLLFLPETESQKELLLISKMQRILKEEITKALENTVHRINRGYEKQHYHTSNER